MVSITAFGLILQTKHYAKYFTFLVVAVFLYIGYTLFIHFDVEANLRFLSYDNTIQCMELAEEAASTLASNNAEIFSPNGSKAVSATFASNSPPRGSTRNKFISTKTETTKWWVTLDEHLGRMGNKMFQYASVVGIGWMTGRRPFFQCSPDMYKIFQLTHVEDMPEDTSWTLVNETRYAYFDPVFKNLPAGNVKIHGYLQSWRYFDKIREHIRKEFTLRRNIRDAVHKVKEDISQELNKTNSVFVGVHVRQRDKMSPQNTIEAPRSYFINAFDKMRSLLAGYDVVYLVAGNRLDWCRSNLNESDVYILPDMSPEMHFAVLSSCEHAILSVGTYGWWMAWLTGGQVIFYKKFPSPESHEYIGFVYGDYYPPNWISVDDCI